MPVEKIVLLTGAGFTHNFGAPMARGMWAKILNRLPGGEADTVRQLLLDDIDYDFEEVYQQVIKGLVLLAAVIFDVLNKQKG